MAWPAECYSARTRRCMSTVGDRDRLCCQPKDDNSIRMRAQSLNDHVGKVLRLTTTAASRRTIRSSVARRRAAEIYTYGHRNGYGLAFHPETGELWEVEIGPWAATRSTF